MYLYNVVNIQEQLAIVFTTLAERAMLQNKANFGLLLALLTHLAESPRAEWLESHYLHSLQAVSLTLEDTIVSTCALLFLGGCQCSHRNNPQTSCALTEPWSFEDTY
jgi:hypothetical protein